MKSSILFCVSMLFCGVATFAQEAPKANPQQQTTATTSTPVHRPAKVYEYEKNFNSGNLKQGVACAIEAVEDYRQGHAYREAFELLYHVDVAINKATKNTGERAALHYDISKARMNLFSRIHRPQSVLENLGQMENYARQANDSIKNDFLYNQAIYFYSTGQTTKGNAAFKELSAKLTASHEFEKVDAVYKKLIENSRRSGSTAMLAETYRSYLAWKDSTDALKIADQIGALKKKISDHEASIAEKDSSLTTRQAIIIGLCVLALALAAALVIGAIILMRFIALTRKQKKLIDMANENNALKAQFISNISAQLEPTLKKLDSKQKEVQALLDFTSHVHTLSELENNTEELETEEISIPVLCEGLMEQIRNQVKKDVNLKVNAPKMTISVNKSYVSHILSHLLENAAEYTPEGGSITLEYKKRGAHTHQFLVSDTGVGIPEEKHEDVFKPFREIRDLTQGDGLGLPTCKQMAIKMDGDLTIDSEFRKGTRFVLEIHA